MVLKKIVQKFNRHKLFLFLILLFAYLQSIYVRILVRRYVDIYIFTPEAAFTSLLSCGLLFLIMNYFLKKWNLQQSFSKIKLFKVLSSSLIVYIILVLIIEVFIAFIFGNVHRNFSNQGILLSIISSFLNGLIYGGFFLAYSYFIINKKIQQKLIVSNRAIAESKINQLKHQLNPHFLFNNLNVLDQLIDEDKVQASHFLNEFSEIYRYVLQSSDTDLVSIEQELEFATQYFNLIKYKYGNAYNLKINKKQTQGHITPLTLQLLIENAIKHNYATIDQPVYITIDIDDNVCVTNTVNVKKSNILKTQKGLQNLKEQYLLLSNRPVEIYKTELFFKVTIPLIF